MTTISPYLGQALRRIATGYRVTCYPSEQDAGGFAWYVRGNGRIIPMISRTAAKGAYLRLTNTNLLG